MAHARQQDGLGAAPQGEIAAAAATRLLSAPSAPDTVRCCALLGGATLDDDERQARWASAQLRSVTQGGCVLSRTGNASTPVALRSAEVALGFGTADGVFRAPSASCTARLGWA